MIPIVSVKALLPARAEAMSAARSVRAIPQTNDCTLRLRTPAVLHRLRLRTIAVLFASKFLSMEQHTRNTAPQPRDVTWQFSNPIYHRVTEVLLQTPDFLLP